MRSFKLVKHNPKVCKHEDWEHSGTVNAEQGCLGKNGRLDCVCPGHWKEHNDAAQG